MEGKDRVQLDLFGEPVVPASARQEKRSRQEVFNDYEGFVGKFKPKKTTDDCYTPAPIYEALIGYIDANVCPLEGHRIVRPFWPGKEFRDYDYRPGDIVIDNPPFSILAKVLDFYIARGVKFWLFAPQLTLFSYAKRDCALVCADCCLAYENGAKVKTSFITNLYPTEVWVMADGRLHDVLAKADRLARPAEKMPRYAYPPNVLTAAELGTYVASAGKCHTIRRGEGVAISRLDCQKGGPAIFGGGLLLSDAAAEAKEQAKERACIQPKVLELSEREKRIIRQLGQQKQNNSTGYESG